MSLNVGPRRTDAIGVIGVVHIHKTAGTTLAGVFKRSFGGGHCDVLPAEPGTEVLTPAGLREVRRWYPRLRSILGHGVRVYTGLEDEEPDIEYVTFLREPIVRTASHYQYDVQRGGVDLPFGEWITHDAVRDRQTRIIAGPAGTAEDAIALMPRFSFVGRADRFDESLLMMQRAVALPDIRYASKWVAPSNDIKKRLLGDPAAMESLTAVNRNDLAVWEHFTRDVYPKQEAEYGPGLAEDLARFKDANARMTRLRMYASPHYAAYVAKWRFLYRPWVRRVTGDPTVG
ncbi:MAG: hypothetical protein V1757_07175 [Actinomycetota bacterium]